MYVGVKAYFTSTLAIKFNRKSEQCMLFWLSQGQCQAHVFIPFLSLPLSSPESCSHQVLVSRAHVEHQHPCTACGQTGPLGPGPEKNIT